jgi:hypothetical protein
MQAGEKTEEETIEPTMTSQIHMPFCQGNPGESVAEDWLRLYNRFADVQNLNQEKRRQMI